MKLAVLVLVAGLACSFPVTSLAQTPGQDSAVLINGAVLAGPFTVLEINATSGPSGENPTGQVRFDIFGFNIGGPVTCLAVRGNTATINVQDQLDNLGVVTVEVVDDQPDTIDALPIGRAPTDCAPLPPTGFGAPLMEGSLGDIVVIDAPLLPTSKEQCKHGGWQAFGVFKNQGDCVSFVATGGKKPPANGP